MSQTIGEATGFMRAATGRVEDTPLIRFINEVERRAAGADLASTPIYDIRAGFDTGEISVGDVYRIYPSENTLRAVRISGEGLRNYLEQSARYWYVDSAGAVFTNAYVPGPNYDVIGGAEYTVDLSRPAGSRITELSVRGKPVRADRQLHPGVRESPPVGEGNYPMLRDAPVVYDRGERIRDLLINEVRRRKELDPAAFAGSSWKLVPDSAALAARALFVRPGTPASAPTTASVPLALPAVAPADDTPELYLAPADETVATMKLPASAGPGGSLLRLMADAYRSSLRADLAIVAAPEGAQDLNSGDVGSRTSALPFREVISCSNSAFGATTSGGSSSIWSREKRPVVRSRAPPSPTRRRSRACSASGRCDSPVAASSNPKSPIKSSSAGTLSRENPSPSAAPSAHPGRAAPSAGYSAAGR